MHINHSTLPQQETNASDAQMRHTTLFDLIDSMDADLPLKAPDIVTDMIINALRSYRISCLGNFQGCEMVLRTGKIFYGAMV